MDDPAIPHAELVASFRFILGINRWLGGARALLGVLGAVAARGEWPAGRPLRLIDVGTGVADLPEAAWRWARARGLPIEITAIDPSGATIGLARERLARAAPRAPIVLRAIGFDALLHEDARRYDVAHAAMLLHHFDDATVARALGAMARVAPTVVWNDLWRNPVSRLAVRVMTLPTPAVVRHDAVLSVDKGFTPREMRARARDAGLRVAHLTHMPLAGRLVATMVEARPGSAMMPAAAIDAAR